MTYLKNYSLKKKLAIVLGGSGLIGSEICLGLSQLGCKVINLDISRSKKLLKINNVEFTKYNLKNISQSEKNLKKILKKHGSPNIFVNCSYPRTKSWSQSSFSKVKLKSIQENVNIHMNSSIWLAKIIAEDMKKNKIAGSIIQFGSTYGVVGQNLNIYKGTNIKENVTYSAIKGGIINNSRLMASYYGKYNIRVNSVCPGGIEGHVASQSKNQPKNLKRFYNNQVPLRRMGKPNEIASTVIFLASDAASYITGSTIMVDGGWTAI